MFWQIAWTLWSIYWNHCLLNIYNCRSYTKKKKTPKKQKHPGKPEKARNQTDMTGAHIITVKLLSRIVPAL